MKYLSILFFIGFQLQAFGQTIREEKLVQAFIEYKMTDQYTNSVKYKQNFEKLTSAIENALVNENILNYKQFKNIADSLNVDFDVKKSEENNLFLYTMSDNFFHWNYIVNGKEIVLKDHKYHQYFTEIHNLNTKEFLLIEQMDELVYACNYATVFQKKNIGFIKKKAFGNKTQLTLCNFTQIENPPTEKPEHFSLPVRKISFDYKNKTFFYSRCNNSITGKMTIGKAKYINGNFKIQDCDERKDFE